jgi:CRISPR/Cas system CMR-associated protein Cmr5 small subunit
MKTLAQLRAANALKHRDKIEKGQGGGDVISGYPMLIKQVGLLAALAFAIEWKDEKKTARKHKGEFTIAEAIVDHLTQLGIAGAKDPNELVKLLAEASEPSQLRRTTAETLAFLNYLKRFVA